MTDGPADRRGSKADVAALAGLVWVGAATLHEALGHGLACLVTGGTPLVWSTFHFDCDRSGLTPAEWRIVSAAGTAVNFSLMAFGYVWWRRTRRALPLAAAWMLVVVNGLTAFGYLVFSAAFGIGDWNSTGVMSGLWRFPGARAALAVVGVAGYYAVVRLGAAMLSRMPKSVATAAEARRTCLTAWLTTGAVSLLPALAAGSEWHVTLGASLSAALGGNAGLLTIARLFQTPVSTGAPSANGRPWLWIAATVVVAAFCIVLGPGLDV